MSEKKRNFETWEEVILDFLRGKIEIEEERYLKTIIKGIAQQYNEHNYFNNPEIEYFFDTKKNKKTGSQSSLEFQRLKFEKIFDFDTIPNGMRQSIIEEAYSNYCIKLDNKYKPLTWIPKASKGAANVSFATHVSKLTHSKIDSPSFYDQIYSQKKGILATSDLKERIIDGAVSGNQYAPVFQFLELELKGDKLAAIFADESNTVLQDFAEKPTDLGSWNAGFKRALSDNGLSSHFLAKQVFFPFKKTDPLCASSYHLLCNVTSSSIAHAIFENLRNAGKKHKELKNTRDKNKYSSSPNIIFPGRATIRVTASNHGNASQLNGKRGGKLELFGSGPPAWESSLRPPFAHTSFFYAALNSKDIKADVNYLRDFLIRFQKIDLSIKDPKKKKWIDGWVNNIADGVLCYAISIQNLPAGWSSTDGIKLKREHQYFLDPYRDDDSFQKARQSTDWQSVVCSDFARWLNGRLRGKDKKFTPQREHTRMWKMAMEKELREQTQMIDADIKLTQKEPKA